MLRNKFVFIFTVALFSAACGSAPNLAGTYEGEAKLRKGFEYIGDTTYDAKLEMTQSGDMATLKLSNTGFSDDCSFSGSINARGEGKITSAPSCNVNVPGNRGTLTVKSSEFFLSGTTLMLKINDTFSGSGDEVYVLEFSGGKK